MKLLKPDQFEAIASSDEFSNIVFDEDSTKWSLLARYSFVKDDYDKSGVPMAQFLAAEAMSGGKCLGIVDKTTVWSSGRLEHLINLVFADCFGADGGRFSDGSAFLASSNDLDKLCTLVFISMIFGWDLFLFPAGQNRQIFLSHNSFFSVHGQREEREEVRQRFYKATNRTL